MKEFIAAFIGLIIGIIICSGLDHLLSSEPLIKGPEQEEIDSIESLYEKARQREQWYLSQLKQDSAGMAELKRKIQIQGIKIKSYEIKLHDIDKVVISNLDSFFIATYPDSLGPDADK